MNKSILIAGMCACLASRGIADQPANEIQDIHFSSKQESTPYATWMYLENDFFVGRDENYTNGFQLGLALPEESGTPTGLNQYLGWAAGGQNSPSLWKNFLGTDQGSVVQQSAITMTQLMFTPQSDMYARQPLYGEHPYAGWLALGLASMVKTETKSVTFSLHMGFVGKNSIAHQTQDYIHGLKDDPKWCGWDNQMPSEFTVMLSLEEKYKLAFLETRNGSWGSDGYVFWDASLGNVYTRAGGGFYLRYGYNLPNYQLTTGWNPSEYQVSPFVTNQVDSASPWSVYVMAGARGYVVGYDIFLDGPLFKDSMVTVDKYPVKAELFYAFSIRYRHFDMMMGFTTRSKEYHGQYRAQTQGTVALRYSF